MNDNEKTCWDCEHGSRLSVEEQKESGCNMFCRYSWIPVDKKSAEECLYFQPIKRIGFQTYFGGSCSSK